MFSAILAERKQGKMDGYLNPIKCLQKQTSIFGNLRHIISDRGRADNMQIWPMTTPESFPQADDYDDDSDVNEDHNHLT